MKNYYTRPKSRSVRALDPSDRPRNRRQTVSGLTISHRLLNHNKFTPPHPNFWYAQFMKRWVLAVVTISLVLFGLTSLIGHQTIDSYLSTSTQKSLPGATLNGWPVTYKSTGDLAGSLCQGKNGLLANNNYEDGCYVPGEFNQPVKLIYDFLFWLAVCSVVGFSFYQLRHRKP